MPFCISICPSVIYVKYDPRIFLLPRKVPEKIHELSIQRQDTVGDILIDNLKPDVFKNGFLKTFCNTIKIVEHTARFLAKRSRNGTAFVRYSACRIRPRYKDLSMMSFALSTCEVSSEAR